MSKSSPTLLHGEWFGSNTPSKRSSSRPTTLSAQRLNSADSPDTSLTQTLDRLGQAVKAELSTLQISQPLRIKLQNSVQSDSGINKVRVRRESITVTLDLDVLQAASTKSSQFSDLASSLICEINYQVTRKQHPLFANSPYVPVPLNLALWPIASLCDLLFWHSSPLVPIIAVFALFPTVIGGMIAEDYFVQPRLHQISSDRLCSCLDEKRSHQLLADNPAYASKSIRQDLARQQRLLAAQQPVSSKPTPTQLIQDIGQVEFWDE